MSRTQHQRHRPRLGMIPLAMLAAATVGGLVPATTAAAVSGGWWNLGTGPTPGSAPLNGPVLAMTRHGNDLYLGGTFTDGGGLAAADRIARWDGAAWHAIGAGLLNGEVRTIAIDGNKIYAGGSFQNANNNGNVDALATWNGSAWVNVGSAHIDGEVNEIVIIGRKLYIGGTFQDAADIEEADGVAAYDLNSHLWSAMTDETLDMGGVYAMAPDGAGGLFVGGSFIAADGIDGADHVARWNGGTSWSALNGSVPNGYVRGMEFAGGNLYIVGDFYNVSGINAADKIARYDGSFHALGSTGLFGEGNNPLYDVAVDGTRVFAVGNFQNANGNAKMDGVAMFSGGTWTNVGSNADGSSGPVPELRVAEVLGSRLYVGGISTSIGGNFQASSVAYFRLRQPDARIKTTGAYAGAGIYNVTGANQTRTANANQGATATFTILVRNSGIAADSIKVDGAGNGAGFTVQYFRGATNITAAVMAGTYTIANLAKGASVTLTLKVHVGAGVANGASRSFLVKTTSTGAGAAADAVKATVNVT